jgi:polyhydroxyalkanoate synthesis regulator phasin
MMDELRRMAIFGSGMVELTKAGAERIVKDLVQEGEVRRKKASSAVKELMETSRANRKELLRFVRAEMQNQIEALGLATKRDVERLERRVARMEGGLAEVGSARKTAARKATARKTTARKKTTSRKKTGARKSTARKTTARRTTAAPSGSQSGTRSPAEAERSTE